jgi:hypothetical protein
VPPRPPTVSVEVDGGRTYQTMSGFGTSARPFEDPHLTNDEVDPVTGRPAVVVPPGRRTGSSTASTSIWG